VVHDFDYRVKFLGLRRIGLRRRSRALLACMAVAIASFGATACGSGEERPAATAVPSGQDQDGDIDSLGQGGRYDTDNDAILTWGPPADAADRAAIVALLKRYYTAAAAGEGAKACTMLDPLIAETVEEDRHAGRGPRLPRGSMCAQIMASMFQQRHRELVENLAAFLITAVQRRGNLAMALTDFSPTRVLQVLVRRDQGVWKMNTTLYNEAE